MTFEPDELRILSKTNLSSVHYLPAVESTNDAAKALADIKLPTILIAGEQTDGRGQQTNKWWSDPNSLTCSWIAESDKNSPDNLTALAAAIATANAIEQTAPGLEPKAKWPNDIYINNAKVAGILVESASRKDSTRIIVGIGINSNCDLRNAPSAIQQRSTSLIDALGQGIDQNLLVIALANQLEAQLLCLNDSSRLILERFRAISFLRAGGAVKLLTRDGVSHCGIFKRIGSHGELIIEQNACDREFFSATIAEYSP